MDKNTSLFRTNSWVESWLETFGSDPKIELIDIGGSRKPKEILYISKGSIRGWLPIKTLSIAGTSSQQVSSPRSEYNNLTELLELTGGTSSLFKELSKFDWHSWELDDWELNTQLEHFTVEAKRNGRIVSSIDDSISYLVNSNDISAYKSGLSKSVSKVYYRDREKLVNKFSEVQWVDVPLEKADFFFTHLNYFHQLRWGKVCYSEPSIAMMKLFTNHLIREGGSVFFNCLFVDGVVESVLFDVQWRGVRYNLQSGYNQKLMNRVKLGSLHLGYGIEQAITAGATYDMLDGRGKNSNYKAKISTHTKVMKSCVIDNFCIGTLRKIKRMSSNLK